MLHEEEEEEHKLRGKLFKSKLVSLSFFSLVFLSPYTLSFSSSLSPSRCLFFVCLILVLFFLIFHVSELQENRSIEGNQAQIRSKNVFRDQKKSITASFNKTLKKIFKMQVPTKYVCFFRA